jgi:hypothetical protein
MLGVGHGPLPPVILSMTTVVSKKNMMNKNKVVQYNRLGCVQT